MQRCSFVELIDRYKVIFLDSYGVIKNHNGMIEGVVQTIEQMRQAGTIMRILTNDASRSRSQQVALFDQLGLHGLTIDDIITSGTLARLFIEDKNLQGKIAYLGTKNAADYILQSGRESISVNDVDLDNCDDIAGFVFLDDEGFDWNEDINKTINLLRRKNIPVVVANSDKLYPVSKRDVAVGTGGIAKLVENILNRKFIHFGKPDTQMFVYAFNQIQQHYQVEKQDILMVGDTLVTDILGGNKFGLSTALVLTGNTSPKKADMLISATGIIPDFICPAITS